MILFDYFAGIGGWGAAFRDRGHTVVSIDIEPSFGCTVTADVLDLDPLDLVRQYGRPDCVTSSPPCDKLSVLTISKNWNRDGTPKTDGARLAIRIFEKAVADIRQLRPRAAVIENPRAMARNLACVEGIERRTVTYCQFGSHCQKPTDLFGLPFPPTLRLPPACGPGDPCHEPAPRGAPSGLQGVGNGSSVRGKAQRAEVPYALSLRLCLAMENWTAPGPGPAQARLGVEA